MLSLCKSVMPTKKQAVVLFVFVFLFFCFWGVFPYCCGKLAHRIRKFTTAAEISVQKLVIICKTG